jgi:carbamoylphosphate synthase large subunit
MVLDQLGRAAVRPSGEFDYSATQAIKALREEGVYTARWSSTTRSEPRRFV